MSPRVARDYYESGRYQRAGDYFLVLSDSGCSGDEGYFLYWAGRSYEAAGELQKACRPYLKILERYQEQKDPSTGKTYGFQALARGLVLAGADGDPAAVRSFLEVGEPLLGGRLEVYDDNGQLLTSAPGRSLGRYCLARALAEEGSVSAAGKYQREGTPPAEGTFFEGGQVRSLPGAWMELDRSLGKEINPDS